MSSRSSSPEPSWTLAEAAGWLDPQITVTELRCLTVAARLRQVPAPPRFGRAPGRPARRYLAADLMAVHAAITPWLERRPR